MIKFICGCTSKMEIPIPIMPDYIEQMGLTPQQAQEQYFSTFDQVQLDPEGFLICAVHRVRRLDWRRPSHTGKVTPGLTDYQFERMKIWGEKPRSPEVEFQESSLDDRRPHIYEGMMDEVAVQAIARAHRPVERHEQNGNGHATPVISAEYCDLATDSSHSSANGLNGS